MNVGVIIVEGGRIFRKSNKPGSLNNPGGGGSKWGNPYVKNRNKISLLIPKLINLFCATI